MNVCFAVGHAFLGGVYRDINVSVNLNGTGVFRICAGVTVAVVDRCAFGSTRDRDLSADQNIFLRNAEGRSRNGLKRSSLIHLVEGEEAGISVRIAGNSVIFVCAELIG